MSISVIVCGFFGHNLRLGSPLLYSERFGIECSRCDGRWTLYGHDQKHVHLGTKPKPRPATSIPLKKVAHTLVSSLKLQGKIDSSKATDLLNAAEDDPWTVIKQYGIKAF